MRKDLTPETLTKYTELAPAPPAPLPGAIKGAPGRPPVCAKRPATCPLPAGAKKMRHLGALSPAIAYKGYPSSSLGSSVGSSGFGTPGAGAGHHPHGGYSYGEGPHTCPAGERPKEKRFDVNAAFPTVFPTVFPTASASQPRAAPTDFDRATPTGSRCALSDPSAPRRATVRSPPRAACVTSTAPCDCSLPRAACVLCDCDVQLRRARTPAAGLAAGRPEERTHPETGDRKGKRLLSRVPVRWQHYRSRQSSLKRLWSPLVRR
eukprot:1122570-Prorocentrum_minimum.AAC.2